MNEEIHSIETYTTIEYYESHGTKWHSLDGTPILTCTTNVDIECTRPLEEIDVEITVGE